MKKFFGNILVVITGNILTLILFLSVIAVFALLSSLGSWFNKSGPKDNSVLELTFDDPIKESAMDENVFSFLLSEGGDDVYFRDILRSIEKAKTDDKIKGISLKASSFQGGSSQLTDIRDALKDFKESGKFIYAYTHSADQSGFILNSVADSVFQNPLGMGMFQGLSAEIMFFKNMGDKYGIDFQVIRHGAYKSAVEPFLRDDMSEENREQMTLLLNDLWSNIVTDMAESKNIPLEKLNIYADSLYAFNPDKSLKFKLVDKLAHEPEYEKALLSRLGITVNEKKSQEDVLKDHTIKLNAYAKTLKKETGGEKIAVLYASGEIKPGETYDGIQPKVYKETIRKIKDDDKIKAVVLRVNSPGGSADVAEEILYELKELKKKKPIIVSFGDVAASGGYYISMMADSIFASPNTITGSIGVLGMIPSFQKLANNFGITTDIVNTNENSDYMKTVFKPLSETGKNTMTEMTEGVYKMFVHHVMEGRGMTFEQVDSIGGGRVWSGTQALKLGLVDKLGTLDDAIEAAATKAGLEKYSISNYPVRKDGFADLFGDDSPFAKSEAFIEQELGEEYYKLYKELKTVKENKGIQVRMPYDIKIK